MTNPTDKANDSEATAAADQFISDPVKNKKLEGPAAFIDKDQLTSKATPIDAVDPNTSKIGQSRFDRLVSETEEEIMALLGSKSVSISDTARNLAETWFGQIRSRAVENLGAQLNSAVASSGGAPSAVQDGSPADRPAQPTASVPQESVRPSPAPTATPKEAQQAQEAAAERSPPVGPKAGSEASINGNGKGDGIQAPLEDGTTSPTILPPLGTMSGSARGTTSGPVGTRVPRGIDLGSLAGMSTSFSRAMPPVAPPPPTEEPANVRLHEAELAELARIEPRLAAELLINQVAHAPNAVKAKTLREAVPVILRNAEAQRNDGELLADIGIKALTSVASTSGFSLPVLSVLPAVRAKLELKDPSERNKGWLESLSNIAVIATSASDELGENHEEFQNATVVAALAYQDALNWMAESRDRFHPSVMRIAGNNLSVALRKVKRASNLKDEDGAIEKVASNLAALAGGAAVDVEDAKDVAPVVLETLGLSFPEDALKAVVALIDTNPRLVEDKDSYALSYAHASQGVIRVARRDERHVVPPFFNAGVTLMNMPSRKTIEGTIARVALNAMGLYFVLEFSGDQETALDTNDGLDCLVNFGGALVEFMDLAKRSQDRLKELFGTRADDFVTTSSNIVLLGRGLAILQRKFQDYARLNLTSERLKINDNTISNGNLKENVIILCDIVSEYYANPFHDIDKADEIQLAIWAGRMTRLIHGRLADDFETEIKKFQTDIEESLKAVHNTWQALVESGLAKQPALVKAGILSQGQWDEFHTFFTRSMANANLGAVFAAADWPSAG